MSSDKITAVITYEKPGTQPPIYVAGTFSNPPWTPEVMSYTTEENGEHLFTKEVHGEVGSKHQYKFRIGDGDWWDLAPGQPTVTDEHGNTNHEMVIQPKDEPPVEDKKPTEVPEETQAPKEPVEVHEKLDTPKEPTEVPEEAQAPKESNEVPKETHAPEQPAEGTEETPALKEPTDVPEETHAQKAPEVPEQTEVPEQPTEVPEKAQAAKEPAEAPEQAEATKEPVAEESAAVSEHAEAPKEPTEAPAETQSQSEPAEVPEENKIPKISVKDSSSSNVVLPSDSILQSIKAQEIRTQSGTGTPDFVRTAAEVADSAALLHEDVPAKDPRDGLLERAPTPMSKTAATAAEVADTAEVLDQVDAILISESQPDDDSLFGAPSGNNGEDILALKSPLFPHECPSPPTSGDAVQPRESREEEISPLEELDPDQIDLNDPTLERFPSNREGIMDTVRKLETSLNEDQASFEGAPPSPVIHSPLDHEGPEDVTDYILGDSSIPPTHRGPQHLKVPRPSHGSASAVPVPPSLQVISEAEEPANEENGTATSPIVFSNPDMKPRPSALKPQSEEEDEGVSLKESVSPRTTEPPVVERSITPDCPKSAKDILFQDTPPLEVSGEATPAKANGASLEDHSNTPKVADESETEPPTTDDSPAAAPGPVGERATDDEIAESSHTTALDAANNTAGLKKRGLPTTEAEQDTPRVTSPVSNRPLGVEPHHGVSWIQAFFRLLFVDIIGGFISRLCGGKKRNTTLMTAGTVAVLMGFGVGWWTLVGKSRGGLTR
ncbi:hypothetical protein QBC40DRAFT_284210 [Triangularia verruculosa]|uniref:AMP-activated protein kinase glycogen-binding domain-containing protein n=1 Tax=Triangularia verruculosa TaxID=2587418 RepID=A0AAN6XCT9_9PEZI|nr:hypothetical protein QBC40DRAFT_284210 [Triangularia verruculosa]